LSTTLDTYFREVSYNKANIAGSNAVGWYTLPHTLTYYQPGTYNACQTLRGIVPQQRTPM